MHDDEFWNQTVKAMEARSPTFTKALLVAAVLRNGEFKTCSNGCCAQPTISVTTQELRHALENYNLGYRANPDRTIGVTVLPNEHTRTSTTRND